MGWDGDGNGMGWVARDIKKRMGERGGRQAEEFGIKPNLPDPFRAEHHQRMFASSF